MITRYFRDSTRSGAANATRSHSIWRSPYSTKWLAISLRFCQQPRGSHHWPPCIGQQGEATVVGKKNNKQNRGEWIAWDKASFNPVPGSPTVLQMPWDQTSLFGTFQKPLCCLLLGKGQSLSALLRQALGSCVDSHLPQIITWNVIWQPPENINGARKHLTAARPLGHFCPFVLQEEIFTPSQEILGTMKEMFKTPRQPCKKET